MAPRLTSAARFIFLLIGVFLSFFESNCSPTNFRASDEEAFYNAGRQSHRRQSTTCDLSVGKWVHDDSYPLYSSARCPFLSTRVSCQKNGRPDSDYEKWRWQPFGCSIPRFNALIFLGRMRRKRIMLVGDSIMRNQWESLACLVQGVLPSAKKRVTYHGPCISLHALGFGASFEFCWAPMLVEFKKEASGKKILFVDLIEENAKYWKGVDVLVFDSAHWWTHTNQWDLVMEGGHMITNMPPMVAYEKGLSTWANWVRANLNPRQTRVIFRSVSPMHSRFNGQRCNKQSEPLMLSRRHHIPRPMQVLKHVLRRTQFPVYLQDITTMSALRRDGHPSWYSGSAYSDCSHWCLPGVPDSWNEMLNVILLHSGL